MPSFLQNLLHGREGDIVRSGTRRYSPETVSLTTMHGAKGLEVPIVFLCGITDGLIPLKNQSGQSDLGEERRLFYVGLTRARDELILLTSCARSPFLADLSENTLLTGNALASKKTPGFQQLSFSDIDF